jgi:tetratricopeptide (TPR) repeat protein
LGEPRRVIENVAEPAYTLAEAAGDGERAANVALVALEALLRENNSPTTVGSPQYKFWLERMEQFAQAGSVYEAVSLISRGRGSRRVEGLREGIDLAKQLGSWNLAYEGGWLLLLAYLTPEHRHDALAVVDEIEALPRTGVDLRNQSMFLQFAACARLLDGDRDAYDSAGKDLEQLAERTRDTNVVLSAEANRALRMILAGELDAALSVSLEAIAFGHSRSAGSVSPIQSAMQAASYLGRESEVRASDFPDGSPLLRSWVLSVLGEPPADLLVSADLRELLEHRIFVDSGAQARMSIMTVAVKRGFEDIARTHLDAFEAGDAAFTAPAILTSVRRHCADAELQFGKPDRARELYEQAIADCAKIRHRPELALSHLGLAELLLEHYPDERDAAIEHLDFAIGEFREMKMQPALERALRHRGLLKA